MVLHETCSMSIPQKRINLYSLIMAAEGTPLDRSRSRITSWYGRSTRINPWFIALSSMIVSYRLSIVVKLFTNVLFLITTYTLATLFLHKRLSRPLPVTLTKIGQVVMVDRIVTHSIVGVHAIYSSGLSSLSSGSIGMTRLHRVTHRSRIWGTYQGI